MLAPGRRPAVPGKDAPMRIFVSAGEPSGDLHGANLARALRLARPDVEVVGFGGERLAEAGCRLLYPLCELAVMGLGGIVKSIPTFWRVLGLARRQFLRPGPTLSSSSTTPASTGGSPAA